MGKGIKESEVFDYTAKRLRDFKEIVDRNKLKEQIEKEWSFLWSFVFFYDFSKNTHRKNKFEPCSEY